MKGHPSRLAFATLALTGAAACAAGHAAHTATTGTPSPSGGDRAWLAAAHQANLAEVEVGELAKKKGGSAAVRAAGAMLVTDHIASDAQVTRVAKSLKLSLPSAAAPADAAAASRLGDEAGAQFDGDFVATMTAGHQKLITATQTEIGQAATPQVRSLAQATLPVLRRHLTMLRQAASAG
jgi:putative membrane protein